MAPPCAGRSLAVRRPGPDARRRVGADQLDCRRRRFAAVAEQRREHLAGTVQGAVRGIPGDTGDDRQVIVEVMHQLDLALRPDPGDIDTGNRLRIQLAVEVQVQRRQRDTDVLDHRHVAEDAADDGQVLEGHLVPAQQLDLVVATQLQGAAEIGHAEVVAGSGDTVELGAEAFLVDRADHSQAAEVERRQHRHQRRGDRIQRQGCGDQRSQRRLAAEGQALLGEGDVDRQRAEDAAAIGNHALVVIAAEQRADHIDPERAVAIAEA